MTQTTLKIVSVSLIAIMLCSVLFSCNTPPEIYESEYYTIEFDGENVTLSWQVGHTTYEMNGTYEIEEKNDTKTIEFKWEESDNALTEAQNAVAKGVFCDKLTYVQGSDDNGSYIEIGKIKFYRK